MISTNLQSRPTKPISLNTASKPLKILPNPTPPQQVAPRLHKISANLKMASSAPTDLRPKRLIGMAASSTMCGISEILAPQKSQPEGPTTGGVYISDVKYARNMAKLSELSVTHVLTLLPTSVGVCVEYAAAGVVQLVIDAHDTYSFSLAPHYAKICKFIAQGRSNGGVLVHCAKGISRSVSAVLIYLMMEQGMTLADAYKLVREKRSVARPNLGFMKQLQALDQKLTDQMNTNKVQIAPQPL